MENVDRKYFFFRILKNKKKFRGVVEITALLLPKITLRKFVSVKFDSNNAVISTTPQNFFYFSKSKKKIRLVNVSKVDFFGFFGFGKKVGGVVEITALSLTDFTLTNFLSVIFGSNNAVISTTPSNFFSETKKIPKSQLWRTLTGSIFFFGF